MTPHTDRTGTPIRVSRKRAERWRKARGGSGGRPAKTAAIRMQVVSFRCLVGFRLGSPPFVLGFQVVSV
eukprot:6792808-Pyramimonas_sp.AAC.1